MVTRRPRPSRRAIFIVVALGLLILIFSSARFYTDVLWFNEIGLASVLWKSLSTQFLVGIVGGAIVGLLIWGNVALAARWRPVYPPASFDPVGRTDPMDRYRDALDPFLGRLRLLLAGGVGLLAAFGISSSWQVVLLWANRVPFGRADPQFGKDIAFYVFELPFLDLVLNWLWFAVIISLLAAGAAHYLHGSIRPEAGLSGILPAALAHVSVLLGLLALIKAAQYWLGQYQLNFSPRGVVTGASYTDVNAQLPALKLLALISIISALLFLVNIRFRRLSLPLAAVGIWILTAVLAGGVWPFVVQRFSVEPQEPQRERPYIDRNIEATRSAFGLQGLEVQSFPAVSELSTDDVAGNSDLLDNVRLWDPSVLQQAYEQLQAIRPYYDFPDVDVDRYEVDGQLRQVLLAARELSIDALDSNNWANEHLQYTHGYGIVASLANQTTAAGQPDFLVKDVPGTVAPGADSLETDQARIYFGERFGAGQYSIVNSDQPEIDYATEEGVQRSSYDGEGGVQVGGLLQRLAFALRESDPNFVLSGLINERSKVLIYRNVRDRVLRAAPFLSLDQDPYPAVVERRLVWILDAFTSTRWYPYSQRVADAEAIVGSGNGALDGQINYVRNSVKVVVDAYDGTMSFYVIDEDDPLIRAWRNAFPDLFTEDPSDELRAHFRYPEDLFKVQTQMLTTYHITDPIEFYSREDAWELPGEDDAGTQVSQAGTLAPTYLLFELPDETEQEFAITRAFTPRQRRNMIAFVVGRSDPEHYGSLVALQFPRQSTVPGPEQVGDLINQDPEISRERTLLGQQGSSVIFGSLVILPIENSIMYVQPLFVAADDGGIPEVKRVILAFGQEVVMGESFDDGLAQLFDLRVAERPPDEDGDEQPPDEPGDEEDGAGTPAEDSETARLLRRASALYDRAQTALARGEFESYGRLIERLGAVLERAQRQGGG